MSKTNKDEKAKEAMLQALEKTMGIVTQACKITGVGRTTFYRYLKEDAEFAKKVRDIENVALDFAESKLHKNIDKGRETSIIFFLKTKGKKRGYIERQEIDQPKADEGFRSERTVIDFGGDD